MHCMGMPFNGTTVAKESLGGSETAAYYMAKELAKMGHKVTLFTNTQDEGRVDDVNYINIGQVSESTPLGDRFHYYAENTPHDVMIIQRHPHAFDYKWQSKMNFWWLHDLATIGLREKVHSMLWNIDGILTVSKFHANQIADTWQIDKSIIMPIQNGVDLEMIAEAHPTPISGGEKRLIYISRPERGLEHLVAHNGIMEQLGKGYHLYVCNYDNTTPQMVNYYNYLYQRCEELPNVTVLGHLNKPDLYEQMKSMDMMVYPCPGPQATNFDEVSCIAAMEAMACGLPMITSDRGALPETTEGSGTVLVSMNDDGTVNVSNFVFAIKGASGLGQMSKRQKRSAEKYDWKFAAKMVDQIIFNSINKNKTTGAVIRDLIRNSDYYAAELVMPLDNVADVAQDELENCYAFARNNTWFEHYQEYYEYEKERGVNYGPEDLSNNPRFEHVSSMVSHFNDDSIILDYGCAHGHYTINMAKRFPQLQFIGIDITETNVQKAREWAESEGLNNVQFWQGYIGGHGKGIEFTGEKPEQELPLADCIVAAEVIEHVGEPESLIQGLMKLGKENAVMIYTTPYGPWEAIGYEEHWPWRAHVWHFDRKDWFDMVGDFNSYHISSIPSGNAKTGEAIGSYVITHHAEDKKVGRLNPEDKQKRIVPMQTVSLCMIARNEESNIKRCLDSVKDIVSEVIIGIDKTTTDDTYETIEKWAAERNLWPNVNVFYIESPLKTGFDEARNSVIQHAQGDWILWMDGDEVLVHPNNLYKYLRNNVFDGYSLKQHHFAVEPLGVMKTDLPVRLFRNRVGIKFFGVVHEHPEKELNEGIGSVFLINDAEIAHYGYETEAVRRGRFDRNIELMVRDREKYPERNLGRFLWMRDLSIMCKHQLEQNGNVSENMFEMSLQAVNIWRQLLEEGHLRMCIDGLEFYSLCAKIIGEGFDFGFTYDVNKEGDVHPTHQTPIIAHFLNREHLTKLFDSIVIERTKYYDSKYY